MGVQFENSCFLHQIRTQSPRKPYKALFIRPNIIKTRKNGQIRISRLLVLPFSPCSNNENVVFYAGFGFSALENPKKAFSWACLSLKLKKPMKPQFSLRDPQFSLRSSAPKWGAPMSKIRPNEYFLKHDM